ncbi:MAG TPA: mevalonate kinase [Nitrososphaerales archaeon]|nr:mevalonate kinase [Nitrososphaerales archaeon]
MRAIAEAPAKAIVTGEHFVVHGAWALAAALPRKVRVAVEPSAKFEVISDLFGSVGSPELLPVSRVVEEMAREFSEKPTVRVTILSDVPGGAGFGSSAATMVAVASAFSRLNSLGLSITELIDCAMVGERSIHGNPSGIDPAICAHGGVILFRPEAVPKKVSFDGTRSLILSYSGLKRSTKGQIGHVSKMKEKYPGMFESLATGMSELSLRASKLLRGGDMKELGTLLTVNHAALMSLGVSNDALDGMVNLLLSMGSYGAKLTGAGGGGSVLALAPEGKEKSIVSGLSARGFETFRVTIPIEGVRSWLER